MDRPRVLELFAGIGGVAAAGAHVVAAFDHDEAAHATYRANFPHPAHRVNLASVRAERLAAFDADLWWMSPPCQPYTVRGARRDLDDPRAASLVHLLGLLRALRPPSVIVENVPGFAGSRAHAALREALAGYAVLELDWCPSSLGVPVERRRFYLVASRVGAPTPGPLPIAPTRPLAGYLDPAPDPALDAPPDLLARFGGALHVVDADDPRAVAACFTSAYGRSPVYAGSWLRERGRVRRFSPAEIARLHGFPEGFALPVSARRAYGLVGNALSVDVVRALLGRLGGWGRGLERAGGPGINPSPTRSSAAPSRSPKATSAP